MAYEVLENEDYKRKVESRILAKSHVNPITGCRIWEGSKDANGYGAIHLYDQYLAIHRVAYEIWVSPIPEGKILMHKCDNPSCIEPQHLKIGTTKDNNKDRSLKGRTNRSYGEDNPYSKLTEEAVYEIKTLFKQGITSKESRKKLAEKYRVTPECIYAVQMERTWKHISV